MIAFKALETMGRKGVLVTLNRSETMAAVQQVHPQRERADVLLGPLGHQR
jgi:hypothetical protein